ncbi:TIGR01548 family HAD-type hydrolase [Thermocoleostomius sinensis]|uniref:TIGR01548 family HAD-type hydrolase n=1 Tax=Thermocoleostomius sinensis A174 TaxID=2016057 RepID=A0A9E9CA97_9CYAN|nr:TIGR01548 family HAD-type hydrolase [Thermocoleostomius sinensis]WAL58670.1 TIGR01548 family HAD-type hydrolase [Thermocoleostomius sinensis A174]
MTSTSLTPTAIPSTATAIVVFDIDGVIRDVGNSYRRALADTVEQFTQGAYRPSQADIDALKAEGLWNNDWEASRELIYRYFEQQGSDRSQLDLDYDAIVAFFQQRYRGPNPDDPDSWTGYICQEPLLLQPSYLEQLTAANIAWGFFSGATRGSATYVLERRLRLTAPVLVAMEDAPGKPDPTGLFATVAALRSRNQIDAHVPVLYAGDTVADLQTVEQARSLQPQQRWIGVGILPPHAQQSPSYAAEYSQRLQAAGATIVLPSIEQLDSAQISSLIQT